MADSIEKSTIAWFGGLLLGAITTTATAVHMLHDQFITPMKVFETKQQVEKLTAKLDSQADIANTLSKTKEELEKAREKLSRIEYSDLFLKNSIYPATVDIVEMGKNISAIYQTYDNKKISVQDDRPSQPQVIVDLENSVFDQVSYSYEPKTKIINSIALSLDYEKNLGRNFLELAVTRGLGAPAAVGDKGQFKWRSRDGLDVYVLDRTYLILKRGFVPRVWGGERTE
ncbi:hypothetical protein BFW86_24535 [Pseudomonas fluorescens]|nr:hypothetical protein BFW86_24535 [Pseudomonas fluorescens]